MPDKNNNNLKNTIESLKNRNKEKDKNFSDFVRELKEDIKSDVKTKWSDEIMAIIDHLSKKYGVGE